jgi:hypothetical protein
MRPHAKLVQYWKAQGLRIAPPADAASIGEFEAKHRVHLPPDIRDYFAHVNGMHPSDSQDLNGYAFWPIGQLRDVTTACTAVSVQAPAIPEHFYVFADYLQWSWAYAISLQPDPLDGGTVVVVGALRSSVVAHTFSSFIDLYLSDSVELYPDGAVGRKHRDEVP